MSFINCLKDGRFLISTDSLFHNFGPRYLIECLPYVTVLKRDMGNSDKFKQLAHFVFGRSFILSDCLCQSQTSFSLTPNLQPAAELFNFSAKSTTFNFVEDTNIYFKMQIVLHTLSILRHVEVFTPKNEVYNKIRWPCWFTHSLTMSWFVHFLMHTEDWYLYIQCMILLNFMTLCISQGGVLEINFGS